MSRTASRPLGILYEHPEWLGPLFDELERRRIPFVRWHVDGRSHDPAEDDFPFGLLLNRMSPSAGLRGRAGAVGFTTRHLAEVERRGIRVLNGSSAWRIETSKAAQIQLLSRLGLGHPRTIVVWDEAGIERAAAEIGFPLIVKPDVGGSGAGVVRFATSEELARWFGSGALDLGPGGVGLVQDYVPPAGGRIVRVEVIGGEYAYAIAIYPEDDFNLCPADACDGLRVEAHEPPGEVRRAVEAIMRAAGIVIGGVEYVVDTRDDTVRYYDVNALSNFVADAERIVGFDPWRRMADWLERELGRASAAEAGAPQGLVDPGAQLRRIGVLLADLA